MKYLSQLFGGRALSVLMNPQDDLRENLLLFLISCEEIAYFENEPHENHEFEWSATKNSEFCRLEENEKIIFNQSASKHKMKLID